MNLSAAYAILTKNRCVFGGRAGTSLMVCSQTPVSTVTPEAGLAGQLFCKGGDKVMKKAVRKGASKAAALVLSLAMIFGMVPLVGASAEETAGAQDNFDRIVHLDMGRKYFTPEWIKALIKESAALGYTALELDFSNNEGFRFSLPEDQMQIEVGGYETVLVEVEPEEPAAPVETTEPTEPVAPVESAEPVELTEPAAPVESAEPVEPTVPAAPVEPTEPAEPTESAPQYKEVQVWNSKTVDLTAALSSDGYITADQMEDIIACADEAGIEIVPLLNSPGHMGAILSVYPEYRWTDDLGRTSESTIDLENDEAVRFAEGVVTAYVQWFRAHSCTAFNIGADEFANDLGGVPGAIMGLDYIYNYENDVYSKLIAYINDLANIVKIHDMTPRAFNDSFCYNNDTAYAPIKDIQICYWSSGWDNYKVASASTLEKQDYQLINTHGDYYYILGKDDCWDSSSKYKYDFSNNVFPGSTISDPVGSMFCIWSDFDVETEQKVAEKVRVPLRIMAACMKGETVSADTVDTSVIPGGFNANGTINTDVPSTTVEDSTSGIKVTAPGLTGIAVEKAEVPALADSTYTAYEITLKDGNGGYTAAGQVSIPLPADWAYSEAQLSGFVLSGDGEVEYVQDGALSNGVYTFTAPHFSTVGVVARAGEVVDVTLTVGEIKEYQLPDDQSVSSNTDPDIASVDAEYAPGTGSRELVDITSIEELESGAKYLIVNQHASKALTDKEDVYEHRDWPWEDPTYYNVLNLGGSSDDVNSPYFWTIDASGSNYTIRNSSGQYLEIGASSAGISESKQNLSLEYKTWGRWVTYSGWYIGQGDQFLNDFQGDRQRAAGYSAPQDAGSLWDIKKLVETPAEGSTTVTITGKAVGTTTAVVGDTTYRITVLPEDLSNVEPLTVEYWITNARVTGDENNAETIEITAEQANSEDGVDLSTLVDQTGTQGENSVVFWKTTVLDAQHYQTGSGGDDETANGEDFVLIRYWDDAWQYYYGDSWQTIMTSGRYPDQVVAYYLQVRNIFPEIDVATKDWGYDPDEYQNTSGGKGEVALTYGLVMNGQVYPVGSETVDGVSQVYPSASTIYNYWDNRDIGIIMALNNSEYEITKITLTQGTREYEPGYVYVPSDRGPVRASKELVWTEDDKIHWDTKETSSGSIWYNEQTVWETADGGTPSVDGRDGYYWSKNNTAWLVLFYVEARKTEDSLTYQYMLEGESEPFLDYNINITNTAGQPDGTFVNRLKQNSPVNTGEFTLDDSAYVENSSGTQIQILKDLTAISDLNDSPYGSGLYTYSRAYLSDDGKTLTLYYNRQASQYQFVADYGLPLTVNYSSLGIENTANIQNATASIGPSYGTVEATSTSVTFKPNHMLNGVATVTVTLQYENGTATVSFDIIPASTVYYEDTEPFVDYSDNWKTVGTADTDRAQTTSKLDDKDVYGYDDAYNSDKDYSGGSAHKVELSSGETATATFSFRGTGFQLVSMTDATSGCITVHVVGNNGFDKYYFVDNYYASGTLYQVPVMKVDGLDLGTYTVTVTAGHLNSSDWNKDEKSTFVLDGIRIYKPIDDYADYAQDNEGGAVYSEIRNILLFENGWDPNNKVYVDTLQNSTKDVKDYISMGPNNEVYLKENDQITFTVPADEGGSIVQIGAKLVSGNSMTFTVNSKNYTITSATEMYYLLENVKPGNTITITAAAGDGILSLTNLKLVSGS